MTNQVTTRGTRHGLAPDPALPARDELLDPVLVADLLSASLGSASAGRVEVSGAELIRVKYRIGESLRVLYHVDVTSVDVAGVGVAGVGVAGRNRLVTGRMFTGGQSAAVHRKAARDPQPCGGLRATALDPGRDTVWWSFPNDRRLVGLDAVLDPARLPPRLRDDVGDWSASEVVQYAPERSVTLKALDPAGQVLAFVKCYAPDTQDVATLAARYDFFAARLRTADPSLRSPRALTHCVDRGLLLLEPMPGRSWLDCDRSSAVDALRSLGRAIAVVHATPLGGWIATGLRRFGRLDLARVVRAGELISEALPDVGAAAGKLTDRLATDPPEPQVPVLLHGDCHPGNVLVAGDRVSLIDIDQAGTGPAAADIGSLMARLAYGAVLRETDAATATLMASAFLEGYAGVRALPDDRTLDWYAAAALLTERSLRAVNRIRPEALVKLPELIDAAHDLLDRRWRQ
jgi:aminoglycoside phosphotransferase (APT) family kinase protein